MGALCCYLDDTANPQWRTTLNRPLVWASPPDPTEFQTAAEATRGLGLKASYVELRVRGAPGARSRRGRLEVGPSAAQDVLAKLMEAAGGTARPVHGALREVRGGSRRVLLGPVRARCARVGVSPRCDGRSSGRLRLLYSIYNAKEIPTHFARVTLWHVYQRLGRRLDSGKRWRRWVDRLHPRLLQLTHVSASDLATDASRVAVFSTSISA